MSRETFERTSVVKVRAETVDISGRHLFWAEEPAPALRASLREVGQLEPVLARLRAGRWSVISGYKRSRILAEAGVAILIMEMPAHPDPVADGLLYLHANALRPLDDVMRLRALRYFVAYMDETELATRIAPLLGTQPRSGAWQRLTAWLDLPSHWDAHLAAGRLPLAAGPALAPLGPADLAALEPYFRDLKWSHSRAVQWLTFITETARREKKGVESLLGDSGLVQSLTGALSPQDKLQRLFARARELRYPNMTTLERRFCDLRGELTRSSRWELIPSEGFEHDVMELRLHARNAADVRQAAQDLQRMAASPRMPELFEVAG